MPVNSQLPLLTQAAMLNAIGGPLGSANPTLNANESTYLNALLINASQAARDFSNRDWDTLTYDEIHHQWGGYPCAEQRDDTYDRAQWQTLKQFPATSLNYILGNYSPVMWVNQTNTATNQFASAQVLSTGLQLTRVASGVTTTVTTGLTWSACPTITQLVAAINALGSGWAAAVNAPYGPYPTANLFIASEPLQTVNCYGYQKNLYMHVQSLDGILDPPTGRLRVQHSANIWPLELDYGMRYRRTIRVNYNAGYPQATDTGTGNPYTQAPADVAEAIAQWIAAVFYKSKANPQAGNLFTAGTGQAVVQFEQNMPPFTQMVLSKYKSRNV